MHRMSTHDPFQELVDSLRRVLLHAPSPPTPPASVTSAGGVPRWLPQTIRLSLLKLCFLLKLDLTKGSYWKMNSSLLKHNEVKSELERLIGFYWSKAKRENYFGLNWELLKYEIGKYLRKCSGNLAKSKRLEEINIVSEISSISKILPENLSDSQRTLVDLQIKLDDLYKLRAEGAFIRSRQR